MILLICLLVYTACIIGADTPKKDSVPKPMPAGLRHLEELEDLRNSQEYIEINDEIKRALPRTPAHRRDPIIFDDPHNKMSSTLQAAIEKIYEKKMVTDVGSVKYFV